MNIKSSLNGIELNADNAVVIGSGILNALGIRESDDIDLVVDASTYAKLANSGRFKKAESYGNEILTDELFEIGTGWGVGGKEQSFADLCNHSIVIDGVRYLTAE